MKTILPLLVSLIASSSSFAADAPAEGAQPMKWSGDIRYRHEQVTKSGAAAPSNYHQQRLRARLGATVAPSPEVGFEFRLATSTGRTSTNQTLGSGGSAFANLDFKLDRAQASWKPSASAELLAGRTRNYLWAPVQSDLAWDSDLNFDGLGLVTNFGMSEGTLLPFAATGVAWVSQSTSTTTPNNLLVNAQVGFKYKQDTFHWALAASLYNFSNFAGQSLPASVTTTYNTTSGGTYVYDYHPINIGTELAMNLQGTPASVGFDYITNPAAPSENKAWLAGFRAGSAGKKGQWMLNYDYRRVETDAVVGVFSDADFLAGDATNGTGHRFSGGYTIADGFYAALNYFLGQKGIAAGEVSKARNKLQLDLNFKF